MSTRYYERNESFKVSFCSCAPMHASGYLTNTNYTCVGWSGLQALSVMLSCYTLDQRVLSCAKHMGDPNSFGGLKPCKMSDKQGALINRVFEKLEI